MSMDIMIEKLSDNQFLLSENGRKIVILPTFKEAKTLQTQMALSESRTIN